MTKRHRGHAGGYSERFLAVPWFRQRQGMRNFRWWWQAAEVPADRSLVAYDAFCQLTGISTAKRVKGLSTGGDPAKPLSKRQVIAEAPRAMRVVGSVVECYWDFPPPIRASHCRAVGHRSLRQFRSHAFARHVLCVDHATPARSTSNQGVNHRLGVDLAHAVLRHNRTGLKHLSQQLIRRNFAYVQCVSSAFYGES